MSVRPAQSITYVPLQVNRNKYVPYRSVQIFKTLFRGFDSPESDPPHKIMRYWFYSSTNTLQNSAMHCNALQHAVTHCITLQHIARHSNNALQHAATHRFASSVTLRMCQTDCNRKSSVLQHTATHCNTLQRTATRCNTPICQFCDLENVSDRLQQKE